MYHAIPCLRPYQNYHISVGIRKSAKRGHCTRTEYNKNGRNSVQRKALMRKMCSREIFTKNCRQQQIFDSDLKGAWHYNHVTFTPIAKNFVILEIDLYVIHSMC